jgi:hypothetical protein
METRVLEFRSNGPLAPYTQRFLPQPAPPGGIQALLCADLSKEHPPKVTGVRFDRLEIDGDPRHWRVDDIQYNDLTIFASPNDMMSEDHSGGYAGDLFADEKILQVVDFQSRVLKWPGEVTVLVRYAGPCVTGARFSGRLVGHDITDPSCPCCGYSTVDRSSFEDRLARLGRPRRKI